MEEKSDYQTVELSQQEMADVTKDLQEVLAKHDCEMQVISNIHILKRQPVETPEQIDVLPSPYGEDQSKESNKPASESSSQGSGKEPSQ